MPDLWIYSFRRTGKRDLSDAERDDLRRHASLYSVRRYLWGSTAVVSALAGVLGILIAAGENVWGWALAIVGAIGFFWALSFANKTERLSLLFRRAARIGIADQYGRTERTDEVRAKYRRETWEEETNQPSDYWEADERFEEKLARQAGESAERFEAPSEDDVVLSVQGKLVHEVIDVPVLQV